MFGGFSSEVILNELAMVLYQEYGNRYIDYDVKQLSAFDNMADNLVNVVADSQIGVKQAGIGKVSVAAGVLLGYIYFADTYGTSLRSFDFNALNPGIKLSESLDNDDNSADPEMGKNSFGYGNYSGMFANCVNLQSVTFPT